MQGSTENVLQEPKSTHIYDNKKSKFVSSDLYLNFATTYGVSFSVVASFPNQDIHDIKQKKLRAGRKED